MNVSLTPQLEALVQGKVASGLYNSASEVVREALRLLEESDRVRAARLADLRRDVAVGIGQIDRGESKRLDDESLPALAEDIKAKGRKRLATKNRRA